MLTKIFLPVAIATFASSVFSAERIKCAPASDRVPEGRTLEAYAEYLSHYNIISKTSVSVNYVEQFKNEFEKFPSTLRAELTLAGNKIHIMEGAGVTVDPTWEPTHEKTFDGRPWDEVPGGGGSTARGYKKSPTRIVINNMYENHGSSHLILHEHGHSLDSIRTLHGISNSQTWFALLQEEPRITSFLAEICGSYCTDNVEEGFAELFANYHGCAESKLQMMKEVPRAAEFFRRFKSTKNLEQIWNDNISLPKSDEYAPDVAGGNESKRRRMNRIFGRRLGDSAG